LKSAEEGQGSNASVGHIEEIRKAFAMMRRGRSLALERLGYTNHGENQNISTGRL
jgi:hypothetical protein